MDKKEKLNGLLKNMGSALVAYSGGVDSTFLLKSASDALGSRVLAVTAVSGTYPEQELKLARRTARFLGARHLVIRTLELKDRKFLSNTKERCYFCKRELFRRLKSLAAKRKIRFVLDASTLSDKSDFRPGNKARDEMGIRSPLVEAGFTKEDVRRHSRALGLKTWDKPPLACLASRIPYGEKISARLLRRIEKGEGILKTLGFVQVRLRHYNHSCRIEVPAGEINKAASRRKEITARLKKLGYNYITLDLEGFRSGSMNEVIKK